MTEKLFKNFKRLFLYLPMFLFSELHLIIHFWRFKNQKYRNLLNKTRQKYLHNIASDFP